VADGATGGDGEIEARVDAFCDAYCAAFASVADCTAYDTCPDQCPLVWMDQHIRCPSEVEALLTCVEATPGSLTWYCSGGVVVVADEACDSLEQPIVDCLNP